MKKTLIGSMIAVVMAGSAMASDAPPSLSEALKQSLPGVSIDSIKKTPVKGVYELSAGNEVAYVSEDGRYMFQGILFDMKERINLTESRLNGVREKAIKELSDNDTIVYPAKGKHKHTITVFTDPSCPYCHKLHAEIPEMNKQGVTVRYVLFPRAGIESPVGKQIADMICAKDQRKEIDKAFSEQAQTPDFAATKPSCDIAKRMLDTGTRMANQMGVQGTPFIVASNGTAIPGYRPASDIVKVLESENQNQGKQNAAKQ